MSECSLASKNTFVHWREGDDGKAARQYEWVGERDTCVHVPCTYMQTLANPYPMGKQLRGNFIPITPTDRCEKEHHTVFRWFILTIHTHMHGLSVHMYMCMCMYMCMGMGINVV